MERRCLQRGAPLRRTFLAAQLSFLRIFSPSLDLRRAEHIIFIRFMRFSLILIAHRMPPARIFHLPLFPIPPISFHRGHLLVFRSRETVGVVRRCVVVLEHGSWRTGVLY